MHVYVTNKITIVKLKYVDKILVCFVILMIVSMYYVTT